jgi:hypothetical protein
MSPSHLLLSPSDSNNSLNISDFSKIGLSSLKESSAFKKIQSHSKSPSAQIFDSSTTEYSKFDVLNKLYNNSLSNSKDYYTDRQDNYTSLLSSQLGNNAGLESKSVEKYINYNYNLNLPAKNVSYFNNTNADLLNNRSSDINNSNRLNTTTLYHSDKKNSSQPFSLNESSYTINTTTDGKYNNNPVKPLLSSSSLKKPAVDSNTFIDLDIPNSNFSDSASNRFSNISSSSKFKDIKSPNMSFLSSDKNSRLISKLHSSKGQFNMSYRNSNLLDIISEISNNKSATNESAIYNSSNSD